jgi:GNAT superfamily N-acetyltransferase
VIARLISSSDDLEAAAAVLLELRPEYSKDGLLLAMRNAQRENNYQIACVESDAGEVLCVAGFVIGYKLAWRKHVYVDDLVTTESHRSEGAGSAMIEWLKSFAREHGCAQLHLDSGVQRFGAHRFYLREGFDIKSHHFAITDLGD